jgi:tryptophanyl-tRNA synthetase
MTDAHNLQGETGKMSASDSTTAIYVTDSAKDIKNKVMFS